MSKVCVTGVAGVLRGDLPPRPRRSARDPIVVDALSDIAQHLAPRTERPSAAQKIACELYGQTSARGYGVQGVAVRFLNVYGPRPDPKSEYAAAIPRFPTGLLAGQRPIVFGDGLQTRDF